MKQVVEPELTGMEKRKKLFDRCKELNVSFPGRGWPSNKKIEKAIAEAEAEIGKGVKAEIEDVPPAEVEAELVVEPTNEEPPHPLYSLPMDIMVRVRGLEYRQAVIEAEPHNFGFFDGWMVIGEEWQRRALLDWAEAEFGREWETVISAEPAGE